MKEFDIYNSKLKTCRDAWLARMADEDKVVYDKIHRSLETFPYGNFEQNKYRKEWRKLIQKELGYDCDPFLFLKAFTARSFQEYFESLSKHAVDLYKLELKRKEKKYQRELKYKGMKKNKRIKK